MPPGGSILSLDGLTFLARELDTIARHRRGVCDGVPTFLDRFGHLLTTEDRAVFESLPANFGPTVAPFSESPFTLIHRDLSGKNTLIGGTPEEPEFVLIDWQQVSLGPGVRDLSFFVGNSVHRATRSVHLDLLREYHGGLMARGVAGYGFDQFVDAYRLSLLCDFARTVAFGVNSPRPLTPSIVGHTIDSRTGTASAFSLLDLLMA